MADRTVKVSLVLAAQSYTAGIKQAAAETTYLGSQAEKLAQKKQAFTGLGTAALGFGAAAGVGVGMAISKFAEFDQQMAYVRAATHETAANMNLLRDAAIDAGARTVYSATEAAAAIEELSRAGVSTANILSGGLDASLDLAAAGGLAVADAAGIAATALKTFNLAGEDMGHVSDLLAAGAGKAMGDVSQLGQALAQGGMVAKSTGLSIEETTAALSAFAAQSLLGSDAGTSLKSMLQRLTPQSNVAAKEMERLGISAYDAQGQFIGLSAFAGNLEESLRDLTPEQRNAALAVIFGSDAVRAANVLYSEGAAGIDRWTAAVDDQGYAAQTAAMRLDNLMGDLEALGGAFDTALIQSGSGANEALRGLVQTVTGAVSIFTELPEPIQQTAVYLGLAAAAVGVLGGAALLATPRVAEFRAIVSAAGLSMKGLSLAAGGVTLGLTAVIAVVAAVSSAQAEARAKAKSYMDTLEQGTNKVTDATRDMVKEALVAKNSFLWMEQDSAADAAEKLGISLELVTDAAMGNAEAMEELQRQIDAGADGSLAYANSAADIENAVKGEADSLAEAADMARQKQAADKDSAESSKTAADAYLEAAAGAEELQSTLLDLLGTINEANSIGQDAVSANAAYQEALAGIAEEVEGLDRTLDESTVTGSANAAMLAEVAEKAQTAAQSQFELDQQTMTAKDAADKYHATLSSQRQAFIDSAVAAGFNATEVQALADKVFALPSEKEMRVVADTSQAAVTISDFMNRYGTLYGVINYRAVQSVETGAERPGRASGGPIFGPGTGTSDTAGLYRLSNGEHVLSAREVIGLGGHGAVASLRAAARSGSAPREAVRYAAAPAYMAQTAPATAATAAAPVQHVHETIQLQLEGRTVFETMRDYMRSGR